METLFALDRELFLAINGGPDSVFLDATAFLLSFIGEGFMLAILGFIGLFLFDRKRFPKNFIVFALILLASGAVTQILKQTFNKPRPLGDRVLVEKTFPEKEYVYDFYGFETISVWDIQHPDQQMAEKCGKPYIHVVYKKIRKRGLPSGHTTAAIGFAICLIYGFRSRWRYLWILFAIGVPWSRIYVSAHFPLDLFLGAIVGLTVPYALLKKTEKYHGLGFRKRIIDRGEKALLSVAIVAGEASADAYGANLIKELKKQEPAAEIFGIGGQRMRSAGFNCVHDSKELSIVGFTAVFSALFTIRRIYKAMLKEIKKRRPQVLVCIDLPDFNLMLAAAAQSLGTRVVYYISPQIWAWRTGRVYGIADRVDRMIIAFPFEKKFYEDVGVDTRFYGHPLLEILKPAFDSREQACKYFGLDPGKKVMIVAPGSRKNETKYLADDLFKAGAMLQKELSDYQFAVPVAPNVQKELLVHVAKKHDFTPVFVSGNYSDLCNIAHFGIITSGTATLEAALFDCPMLIVYKGHRVNVALARRLVKIENFGLPNIVAEQTLFPEILQDEVNGENLSRLTLEIVSDKAKYEEYLGYCIIVRRALKGGNTSSEVAGTVLELVDLTIKGKKEKDE